MTQFTLYEHLYMKERDQTITEFLSINKHLSDVEGEIEHYEYLESEIAALPHQLSIGHTVLLSTGYHYNNLNSHIK